MHTPEQIRALVACDFSTGKITRRKVTQGVKPGHLSGRISPFGYVRIHLDNVMYMAHRLVWACAHGSWPAAEIDHINGIRTDNRLCNLREATRAENMQNQRRAQKHGTSGFLGVSRHKKTRKWQAAIRVNHTRHYLGLFDTPEDASEFYLLAKAMLHPFSREAAG